MAPVVEASAPEITQTSASEFRSFARGPDTRANAENSLYTPGRDLLGDSLLLPGDNLPA